MKSVEREKILSGSNIIAFLEEGLHRFGELGEDEHIELPWKVDQIPIKIYTEKKPKREVKVYYRNGKNGQKL